MFVNPINKTNHKDVDYSKGGNISTAEYRVHFCSTAKLDFQNHHK